MSQLSLQFKLSPLSWVYLPQLPSQSVRLQPHLSRCQASWRRKSTVRTSPKYRQFISMTTLSILTLDTSNNRRTQWISFICSTMPKLTSTTTSVMPDSTPSQSCSGQVQAQVTLDHLNSNSKTTWTGLVTHPNNHRHTYPSSSRMISPRTTQIYLWRTIEQLIYGFS